VRIKSSKPIFIKPKNDYDVKILLESKKEKYEAKELIKNPDLCCWCKNIIPEGEILCFDCREILFRRKIAKEHMEENFYVKKIRIYS